MSFYCYHVCVIFHIIANNVSSGGEDSSTCQVCYQLFQQPHISAFLSFLL